MLRCKLCATGVAGVRMGICLASYLLEALLKREAASSQQVRLLLQIAEATIRVVALSVAAVAMNIV